MLSWLVAGLLVSCASKADKKQEVTALDKMIETAFSNEPAATKESEAASPDQVASALLPDINLSVPGSGGIDVEPRFDIKVNRANVRQFFMGLVEGTPYNMVLHPSVAGKITLDLKNVTVNEVMKVVRDVYGYDFEQTKTGFQVFPNTMQNRIFKVNYLNVNRSGDSQMRVSSGQVTESVSSNAQGTSTSTQNVSGSQIQTKSQSNFWAELKDSLTAIVGNKDGRNVVISPQSGIVVVRAMPHELREVEKYLNDTQKFVQRQVIIQAKILEVELSDHFQSGINWAALKTSKSGNNSVLAGQTGGGSIFSGSGFSGIAGNEGNLNPSAITQPDGTATSAFGGVFSLALSIGNDFSAFIELLKGQGNVQVLSSPQVSTVNNQKAVIKVGQDEFFITDVESNTNTSTATTTTQNNVELTPFFSGVALDVIPQIDDKGEIILHIHPTVSSVTEKVKNISVSSTTALSVPLAVSSIRESDTIIRAKSGQVVVLGGLMKNSVEKSTSGVPLLGDLPLIGGLFRHTQDVTKKSELVILLRPVVIDSDDTWTDQVRQIRSRFNRTSAAQKKQKDKEDE